MRIARLLASALIVAGIAAEAQVFEGLDLTPKKPPKKTSVSVTLTTPVTGAQLFIDGEDAGALPVAEKVVKAGAHTLKVVRPGYATLEEKVTVAAGKKNEFSYALVATGTAMTLSSTTLGLTAAIDGASAEMLPVTKVVTPGKHTVVVSGLGYANETRTIDAKLGVDVNETFELEVASDRPVAANLEPGPDQDSDLEAELSRKRRATAADTQPFFSRWYVWAGIGAVVVGAAVGVGVAAGAQRPTPLPNTVCGGTCDATIGWPAGLR